MQQVQGFSRLQTVPSEPATAARRKLWILSSWRDLVLYVGTPLLLIPAFALAQAKWSPQDIYLFVAAFGAMGHHLPGMIRAYGDRALFERFKWRFILAPLFLLAACVAFFWWDLKGILASRFLLGRLARIDADLRVLPHLRRENGNVRYAYAPARFRHVPDLVCHCGGAFAIPAERHAGHLLHVWRAVHSAVGCKASGKT